MQNDRYEVNMSKICCLWCQKNGRSQLQPILQRKDRRIDRSFNHHPKLEESDEKLNNVFRPRHKTNRLTNSRSRFSDENLKLRGERYSTPPQITIARKTEKKSSEDLPKNSTDSNTTTAIQLCVDKESSIKCYNEAASSNFSSKNISNSSKSNNNTNNNKNLKEELTASTNQAANPIQIYPFYENYSTFISEPALVCKEPEMKALPSHFIKETILKQKNSYLQRDFTLSADFTSVKRIQNKAEITKSKETSVSLVFQKQQHNIAKEMLIILKKIITISKRSSNSKEFNSKLDRCLASSSSPITELLNISSKGNDAVSEKLNEAKKKAIESMRRITTELIRELDSTGTPYNKEELILKVIHRLREENTSIQSILESVKNVGRSIFLEKIGFVKTDLEILNSLLGRMKAIRKNVQFKRFDSCQTQQQLIQMEEIQEDQEDSHQDYSQYVFSEPQIHLIKTDFNLPDNKNLIDIASGIGRINLQKYEEFRQHQSKDTMEPWELTSKVKYVTAVLRKERPLRVFYKKFDIQMEELTVSLDKNIRVVNLTANYGSNNERGESVFMTKKSKKISEAIHVARSLQTKFVTPEVINVQYVEEINTEDWDLNMQEKYPEMLQKCSVELSEENYNYMVADALSEYNAEIKEPFAQMSDKAETSKVIADLHNVQRARINEYMLQQRTKRIDLGKMKLLAEERKLKLEAKMNENDIKTDDVVTNKEQMVVEKREGRKSLLVELKEKEKQKVYLKNQTLRESVQSKQSFDEEEIPEGVDPDSLKGSKRVEAYFKTNPDHFLRRVDSLFSNSISAPGATDRIDKRATQGNNYQYIQLIFTSGQSDTSTIAASGVSGS